MTPYRYRVFAVPFPRPDRLAEAFERNVAASELLDVRDVRESVEADQMVEDGVTDSLGGGWISLGRKSALREVAPLGEEEVDFFELGEEALEVAVVVCGEIVGEAFVEVVDCGLEGVEQEAEFERGDF